MNIKKEAYEQAFNFAPLASQRRQRGSNEGY